VTLINLTNSIDTFIKIISYLGAFVGLWMFASPMVVQLLKQEATPSRFRKREEKSETKERKRSKLLVHLQRVLKVTYNINSVFAAYNFIIICCGIGGIIFSVLLNKGYDLNTVLSLSVLAALVPYAYLRVKLRNMRIEGSYEGNALVKELINQYKINSLNMIEAIDKTVPRLKDAGYSQRALFRLSLEIKEYKSEEELQDIIDDFVFGIDTEWAILLGMNIYLAIHDGIDVRLSLEDIILELKIIKELLEDNKRGNIESFKLIKYIIPTAYIATVFVAVKLFSFTIKKFFDYQFGNKLGVILGVASILLMVVNLLIANMLKKPKFDY
jgi:hypothetical protein